MCLADGLWCAEWEDSQYGEMASCEECTNGEGQFISDSYGDLVEYTCPPESMPVEEGDSAATDSAPAEEAPASAAPAAAEEESSMKLMASTVAVAAVMFGSL
jgi:hypothetical protein